MAEFRPSAYTTDTQLSRLQWIPHRGDLCQPRGAGGITTPFFVREQMGQDGRIIVNDTVGNEPTALLPHLLLVFGLETQFAEVRIGHRTAELMVILKPCQII